MLIGTTFSNLYTKQLGLDVEETFQELLQLKFDVVRLCCYWNEVQPDEKTFDYSALKKLLDQCEKNNLVVVMTIGMKAPRWPEFYLPKWIAFDHPDFTKFLFQFIERTITELKFYSCIKYWQVENEPLDPSGPDHKIISLELLQKEIELVKKLDPDREIILTAWGNELVKRNCIPQLNQSADIVGLDLYYKVPTVKLLNKTFYVGPNDSSQRMIDHLTCTTKPVWIMELQAEPWEKNVVIPKIKEPQSMNDRILQFNFDNARELNPQAILFWGFEYWIWRKKILHDESLFLLVESLT